MRDLLGLTKSSNLKITWDQLRVRTIRNKGNNLEKK